MKATPMQKRSFVIIRFDDAEPKHVMEVMLAMTEVAAKRNLDFEWVTFPPRTKLKTAKKPKPTSKKHVLVSRRKLKTAVK